MTCRLILQVLKGSRQGLSTLSIVLLQHLENVQYPAGFNSVKKTYWESRLQAASIGKLSEIAHR